MGEFHVACAAEGTYDAHSAAMLHSVAEHSAGGDLHVHYLHGPGFPRRSTDRIGAMLRDLGAVPSFHEIAPERVAGLHVVDEFTAAMWYRLFLPELVPEADRVLYLDIDTIATDSIAPLWDIDLAGHWLGAVTNVFMRHHLHRPAELGLPGPEGYFNSGVLLMNLDEMRRDGCTEQLVEFARSQGDRIEWPDQDTLNLVLGPRRLWLHPRWNAMNALRFDFASEAFAPDVLEQARERPAIRHFEGPGANKPWHADCDPADRELYLRHRRATPWPRVKLQRERPPGRLRRAAGRVRRKLSA